MAADLRWGVINVVVLVILAGFPMTIWQATSVESDQNKADKLAENSKIGYVKEKAGEAMETSEKAVEGAGTASWDTVKTWANVASEKLPKSFSFKDTAEPASHDSHGTAETVKETATKGYEIGKKATQDVIDNAGQAAQKIGLKIKQTAGEL